MVKALEILKKILETYGYSEQYQEILVNHILQNMKEKKLDQITPNVLYSSLIFEVGRKRSQEISELFDEYLKTGNFKTPLEKYLERASWMK